MTCRDEREYLSRDTSDRHQQLATGGDPQSLAANFSVNNELGNFNFKSYRNVLADPTAATQTSKAKVQRILITAVMHPTHHQHLQTLQQHQPLKTNFTSDTPMKKAVNATKRCLPKGTSHLQKWFSYHSTLTSCSWACQAYQRKLLGSGVLAKAC